MKWLIAFLLIAFSVNAAVLEIFIGEEITVDDDLVVAWDAATEGTPAEFYELSAEWIDVEPTVVYELGRTSALEFTVQFPRSGHFRLRVRAGAYDEEAEEEIFSDYCNSTDPACANMSNGEAGAWRTRKVIVVPEWNN